MRARQIPIAIPVAVTALGVAATGTRVVSDFRYGVGMEEVVARAKDEFGSPGCGTHPIHDCLKPGKKDGFADPGEPIKIVWVTAWVTPPEWDASDEVNGRAE